MAKHSPLVSYNVDLSAAATTEIAAAPGAGKKIRVHSYGLIGAGAGVTTLLSAATVKCTINHTAAGIGMAESVQRPDFLFECAANEALNITLSAAVRTTGRVGYSIVPSSTPGGE